jgi:hypothetical protein
MRSIPQSGGRHRGTGRLLGEYARLAESASAVPTSAGSSGFHPHAPLGEAAADAANIKHVFDYMDRSARCQHRDSAPSTRSLAVFR